MNNCPQRAIETAFGFTFILWWGIFSLVPVWILTSLFEGPLIGLNTMPFLLWLIYNIIYISASLLMVLISYYVLHFFMKFSFFERLVAYTSLTRYRWWRRYTAPKEL
jgi:hypothetical protein